MANLDCSATNCHFNCDHGCSRGEIQVGGQQACQCSETCCESFQPAGGSFRNAAREACSTISISCEAVNCMYNENNSCHADHIGIAGGHAMKSAETECASFRER